MNPWAWAVLVVVEEKIPAVDCVSVVKLRTRNYILVKTESYEEGVIKVTSAVLQFDHPKFLSHLSDVLNWKCWFGSKGTGGW